MSNPSSKYKSISPSNITDLDTPLSSNASAARTLPISSKWSSASKTLHPFGNESSNTCVPKSQTLFKSKSVFCFNKEFHSLPPFKSQTSITSKPQDVFKTKSSPFSKDASFRESTAKSSSYTKQLSPNASTCKSRITSKTDSLTDVKTHPPILSKSPTASKTLSPFGNKYSTTCITKSQTQFKSESVFCSNKDFPSLPPFKLQSLSISKSQDVFKTKSSPFSKDESFSDSTTNSSYSTNQPSLNVSTSKSQITSETDSPYNLEFSKPHLAKTQIQPKRELSLSSESSNTPLTESQAAPKTKSSLMSESSNHSLPHVFKENSTKASNKRSKRQRRCTSKKIQRETLSVKANATDFKMLKNAKSIQTNKELASKSEKSQMEISSCKKVKNVAKIASIKFVARGLQSSCPLVVDSLPHNIKKDVSLAENLTNVDNMVDFSIEKKYEFKNISINQNTESAMVSILNTKSKCIPRKRIIYDEKMEEQRKRTMSDIKVKQKLLKDILMQAKYFHDKNVKDKLIVQAEAIQSEIDTLFQKLDELGKMPNYSRQKKLVKPKVNKAESIKSLQTLLQHLAEKTINEVNIENVHQFINFEIVEEAFDEFLIIKKQHLKRTEVLKHKMNSDLQYLLNFLKLNCESFTSNALFPKIYTTNDILSLNDSLRKSVENNLRHLFRLRFLASNFMNSVRNYRISEKLLFEEWNSFIFNDHKNFFMLRRIR